MTNQGSVHIQDNNSYLLDIILSSVNACYVDDILGCAACVASVASFVLHLPTDLF